MKERDGDVPQRNKSDRPESMLLGAGIQVEFGGCELEKDSHGLLGNDKGVLSDEGIDIP